MTAARKNRILVVDDAPTALDILERNLSSRGYQVLTASNVADAVKMLEQSPVDLVITDYKMPKISGLDLVRHVRENYFDTEVIMITGYASVKGAVEAVKMGRKSTFPSPSQTRSCSRPLRGPSTSGSSRPWSRGENPGSGPIHTASSENRLPSGTCSHRSKRRRHPRPPCSFWAKAAQARSSSHVQSTTAASGPRPPLFRSTAAPSRKSCSKASCSVT